MIVTDLEHAAGPEFEYHREYIDVQYIASGAEVMGWAPAGRLTAVKPYDADKDAGFGSVRAGEWTPVRLEAGQEKGPRPARLAPENIYSVDAYNDKLAVKPVH